MNTPKLHHATVSSIKQENEKIISITLKTKNPDFSFEPGQYVSLNVGQNIFRSYSIAGDYGQKGEVFLLISAGHDGAGANFTRNLKIDDSVSFVGPSGRFKLKYPLADKLYFFATGTGIAPFLAFFYKLQDQKYRGEIKVFFGLRNHHEDLCFDKLESFRPDLNIDIEVWYSQERGRITKPAQSITDKNAHYYLCGHPNMIEEVSTTLFKNGIAEDRVFFERFTRSAK